MERAARQAGQPWKSGRTQVIVGWDLPGSPRKGGCQKHLGGLYHEECNPCSPAKTGTGHPFQPSESAPSQNQQDFCPLPAARLALLWLRFLQKSGYCLSGMSGQLSGSMGTLHRKGIIILTYVLASLELTCLFMQFSFLPYLSRTLGLDSVTFGYLQTIFGTLQLLGGPVFGRFADQYGARAALSLSFVAASAFYLLLAASCSPALPGVFLLFASRLPSALMHTLTAAQMIITDLTAPAERPAALGRLGLCFGVGIIFGSLLGGTLSTTYGIQCPAMVAFVVTFLGAILSFTCVPVTTKDASVQSAHQGGTNAGVFDLKAITRLLLLPRVLPVFLVKVISGFPAGLFLVMFSIISMDFFQLEAAEAGYLMSFVGILQMVIQGLVVGRLSTHFPEEALLQSSVLVYAVVGLGMALMSSVLHFCFLVPGLVFSLCTLNVVTDSMLTKAVSASDTGTMLGLSASVHPLTRTIGPTLGGLLYRSYGVSIFGHVQLMVNLLVLLVLWRKPLSQKKDKVR